MASDIAEVLAREGGAGFREFGKVRIGVLPVIEESPVFGSRRLSLTRLLQQSPER